MSKINVLPIHLVNKIAAGEVIERPASVVKELVENALDADATRIDVGVEDGGRRLISVADNGAGMDAEDLALAFRPHATSKITVEDDLFRIATMGFRGEALASVASISHAHIRSRRAEAEAGHEVEAAGETLGEVRPCAAAAGTAVTIRDLFFNTPARRKFMRTANTEYGHISEQITRLALPQPRVAFRVTHNGRETMNLPAVESTALRCADLFGAELAQNLLPVAPRGGPVGVAGLVGRPAAARASGKWQYFFLNGRYVRDRLLAHALREAFRGRLDPKRWPVAMLFVEIDPAEVDVNVHPTKIEVRFRDGNAVYGAVLAALKETLNKADLAPQAQFAETNAAPGTQSDGPPEIEPPDDASDDRRESLRQALADFFQSAPARQGRLGFGEQGSPARNRGSGKATAPPAPSEPPARAACRGEASGEAGSGAAADAECKMRNAEWPGGEGAASEPPARASGAAADAPPASESEIRNPQSETDEEPAVPLVPAVQLHDSYIVAATGDGLEIIDQHALHERILYNDLRRRLAAEGLSGQQMLIPLPVRVTDAEADVLAENAELLASLGIQAEPFGPGTVAVQRFPTMLAQRGVAADAFLRELLDLLTEGAGGDAEPMLEATLEMMACKAAVKAGDPLGEEEIQALLARRADAEKGASCPHGRPTAIRLSLKELERQFKRS